MLNKKIVCAIFLCCVAALCSVAAYGKDQPTQYRIRVDAADLTGFDVEMIIERQRPGLLRVAMAVHPEYDDRYFRYIENFSASDGHGGQLSVRREEDTVWRIENAPQQTHIRYRLRLPPPPQQQRGEVGDAWKPFLTRDGGMVGDLHSLMYVVGEENRRARLDLEMPAEWTAASGLEPTLNPRSFTGSTELMLDSPIMIGKLKQWNFDAAGVPHSVVIWSASEKPATDPAPVVDGIKKIVNEAIRAFGRPPYPRYMFLLQEGGQAALEHQTSVNIGTSSLGLEDLFEEIAHEYIHVWNLMDVRPKTRVGIRYRFADPTGVLWWSEGATIMFSDLLIRRSRVPGESRSRMTRLESLMARYFSSPGYSNQSAETVSRGDSHPEILGDNFASTHLQGELLTTMLDLEIRSETANQRNATDVMRRLATRFDSGRGIDNSDIERAIGEVCGCDKGPFFRDYIYGARAIDFNYYLALIGLRSEVRNIPSVDDNGLPVVDLRVGPLTFEGDFKVRILNTESVWAKAGIRTGDTVVSADGEKIAGWQDFRAWLRRLKIGDTARLVISRDGNTRAVEVAVRGFDRAVVHITELKDATAKQLLLRNAWLSAH
jgi:predicted metalloprotease with PDZ domain